jgi:hypothetical protein
LWRHYFQNTQGKVYNFVPWDIFQYYIIHDKSFVNSVLCSRATDKLWMWIGYYSIISFVIGNWLHLIGYSKTRYPMILKSIGYSNMKLWILCFFNCFKKKIGATYLTIYKTFSQLFNVYKKCTWQIYARLQIIKVKLLMITCLHVVTGNHLSLAASFTKYKYIIL